MGFNGFMDKLYEHHFNLLKSILLSNLINSLITIIAVFHIILDT